MFAGWPANHGVWQWGNEILVGFVLGRYKDTDLFHAFDFGLSRSIKFARSLDGGETWTIEDGYNAGLKTRCYNHTTEGIIPTKCPGNVDFTSPGFAAIFGRLDNSSGPSHFHLSTDKGKSWQGSYELPNMGTPGIAARTNYIVEGPQTLTAFFTCAKENEHEGQVLCARTMDGGANWERVGWVAKVDGRGFAIMPSAVKVEDGYVCAIRKEWKERSGKISEFGLKTHERHSSIGIARSSDGRMWKWELDLGYGIRPSSPPWLVTLPSGQLACVYTVRQSPYRIRVSLLDLVKSKVIAVPLQLSLRSQHTICDDGVSHDIGYTVACVRPDGKLVVVYYWHDSDIRPERYIRATIWEPPK